MPIFRRRRACRRVPATIAVDSSGSRPAQPDEPDRPALMSALMRSPSASSISGPNACTSGRRTLGLHDQQRLAVGVSCRNQQEARAAAEGIELVGHAIGLEGRVLAGEPAGVRGDRDLLHDAQRRALAAGSGMAGRRRTGRRRAGRRSPSGSERRSISIMRSRISKRRCGTAVLERDLRPASVGAAVGDAHAACESERAFEQRAAVVPPCAASIRFSGCGIRPSTLPRSLMMPAMSLIEPFGLVPSA